MGTLVHERAWTNVPITCRSGRGCGALEWGAARVCGAVAVGGRRCAVRRVHLRPARTCATMHGKETRTRVHLLPWLALPVHTGWLPPGRKNINGGIPPDHLAGTPQTNHNQMSDTLSTISAGTPQTKCTRTDSLQNSWLPFTKILLKFRKSIEYNPATAAYRASRAACIKILIKMQCKGTIIIMITAIPSAAGIPNQHPELRLPRS